MRGLAVIALLAALAPWAGAQRTISVPHFASPRPTLTANRPGPESGFGFNGGGRARSFYPLALFPDSAYADALYSAGYPVASQPPVIILQAPPAAPAADSTLERFPSPPEPLMIELQGGRYVRVSGEDASGVEVIGGETDRGETARRAPERTSDALTQAAAPRELPLVVLVFRDGRREEVSDYTIADGVLYARADYYTVGSWNKKIELAALDLTETVSLNRSRGVQFRLPTAPNEVMVGP